MATKQANLEHEFNHAEKQETKMKKFVTIAIVAAGLAGVSTVASASPDAYSDYPTWAQKAFSENG